MINSDVTPMKPEFNFICENIAYWFFRLNGCFILENFLVHHERRGREGTEIDILSTRFPFRQELLLTGEAMPDHPIFESNGKIDITLAEIKKGRCDINPSWFDPELKNIERILYLVGAILPQEVSKVAKTIYSDNYYENSLYRFRLFAIGTEINTGLNKNIIQIDWTAVLQFIHTRFSSYWRYKTQHRQWDPTGRNLFLFTDKFKHDPENFADYIISRMH